MNKNEASFMLRLPVDLKEKAFRKWGTRHVAENIRILILTAVNVSGKLEELEQRFALVEPEYISIKKEIDTLRLEKTRQEDEKRTKEKRIEETHQKLLAELIQADNRVEDVSKSIIRFWSDRSGESVDVLTVWLAEQALTRKKAK